jgi:hypothetical protein
MKRPGIAGTPLLAGGAFMWALSGLLLSGLLLSGLLLSGCERNGTASFARDVRPILAANCFACHQDGGAGFEASGFKMTTYDDLMKGTQYGPMILPGDAEGSNLVVLMEGRADPSISMPHGKMDRVPKADIDTIRRWIDQGAKDN